MNTRMMFARAGGECCQCENVAITNTNFQLDTGNIGIGNTCTLATFNMMFARAVAGAAKMIVALFLLAAIVVGLVVAMEFPGMRKYERLCDYPNKDALLAAEPDEVKKVIDFSQDGTNYTAVVLSWIGLLPSGPAVIIYDADGRLIDRCSDSGDNMSFNERWHFNFAGEDQKEIERSNP